MFNFAGNFPSTALAEMIRQDIRSRLLNLTGFFSSLGACTPATLGAAAVIASLKGLKRGLTKAIGGFFA